LTTQYSQYLSTGESGLGKTTFINTLFTTSIKTPKTYKRRYNKTAEKTVEIEIIRAGMKISPPSTPSLPSVSSFVALFYSYLLSCLQDSLLRKERRESEKKQERNDDTFGFPLAPFSSCSLSPCFLSVSLERFWTGQT